MATSPLAVSKNLDFLDSRILKQLKPFDLAGCILEKEAYAVGIGSFSDVFKGVCIINEQEVSTAMKRLRLYVDARSCKELFEKEIYVWSKLQHPNVLPLLGYAFDADTGYPILISEWMGNGNALAYVRSTRPPSDVLLQLVHEVLEIARGLAYIHNNSVVHSDLKPENILIGPLGQAMICDFGCARMEIATQSIAAPSSTLKGTCNYWAPELVTSQGSEITVHSKLTDIWAFGMTVYAVMTGQTPYQGMNAFWIPSAIVQGTLPEFPANDDKDSSRTIAYLRHLCKRCWDTLPASRPYMTSIVDELEAVIHETVTATAYHNPVTNSEKSNLSTGNSPGDYVPSSQSDSPPETKTKTARGTFMRVSHNRIYATFDIDAIRATYSATISPSIAKFMSSNATVTYNNADDLTSTRSYNGRIGTDAYKITIDNGIVIEGTLNGPGIRPASTVSGCGSWEWN